MDEDLICHSKTQNTLMRKPLVFIHLWAGLDGTEWAKKYEKGEVDDHSPYGYHHAEEAGYVVRYSETKGRNRLMLLIHKIESKLIGFDLLHAWNNRKSILAADVVWTHTEREHLAVLFLLRLLKPKHLPRVIAQSVWMYDNWKNLSRIRRNVYIRLLRRATVLTVHSPENAQIARQIMPNVPTIIMPFGIPRESYRLVNPYSRPAPNHPIRVLALGNDRHRDWTSLLKALANRDDIELCIASPRLNNPGTPRTMMLLRSAQKARNVTVTSASTHNQVMELYGWADVCVVPLKRNLHVSGISTIFEAVTQGIPVIASDTGGLRYYFPREIHYVPLGSGWAAAIYSVIENWNDSLSLAAKAQSRMEEEGYYSNEWALRHVHLTNSILSNIYPTTESMQSPRD